MCVIPNFFIKKSVVIKSIGSFQQFLCICLGPQKKHIPDIYQPTYVSNKYNMSSRAM